jgi:uncharacterized cupin superfamily protein
VESAHEEKFASKRKQLGAPAGGRMLGCSLLRLEPGKTAYPAHIHYGNEEAVYVLEGKGSMRLGDEKIPVQAGDYIAMPVAGPAHQLINDSDAALEYLCISTMIHPEVVYYSDSDKVGMMAGSAPGGDSAKRLLGGFAIYRKGTEVGYYDGE